MDDARFKELEKRIAALEEIVQEQQKIIDEIMSLKANKELSTIKHPTLLDEDMLC
jgi:uncharacterized coiled-coil protein SlyX